MDPRLKEPNNVDVSALCDVNTARLDAAKRKPTPIFASCWRIRISTWPSSSHDPGHASMLILACDAGKDVYLEKPVMYRVGEAKAMLDAVREQPDCSGRHPATLG
jgi:hypothetical protein